MKKTIKLLAAGSSWISLVAVGAFADGAFEPVVSRELPVVSSPVFSPGHGFGMTVHAAPGIYGVEESDDLITWNPLAEMVLDGAAEAFTDAESAGLDHRFYRVTGDFEVSDYHLLDSYMSVETDAEGRLFFGFRRIGTLRLASSGAERAALRVIGEDMADFSVSPSGLHAAAFVEEGPLGTVLADSHPDGLTVQFPGYHEVDNEFDRTETRDPWELPMLALDGESDTFVGLGASSYEITESGSVTQGREAGFTMAGRKSKDANLDGLDGPWGFVRYLIEAEQSDALYNVGAYAFDINAQTEEVEFSYVREAEIEQGVSASWMDVNLGHVDEAEIFSGPIALAPDGSFDLFDGEIHGFFSSRGNWFSAVAVRPDLREDLEDGDSIEEPVVEAAAEFFVGVRRDTDPQLAGRSYRVMAVGNWVESNWFEIDAMAADENSLVFGPDGNSAEETMAIDYFRASFGGTGVQGSEPVETLNWDVSVDGNGLIRMDLGPNATMFGFAQEGGEVLIFGRGFYDPQYGGGLHTVIAVEME